MAKLKTLKEMADEEADAAEREAEEMGVDDEADDAPTASATSEPGEQGIATQDEDEEDEAEPFVRQVDKTELGLANDLYSDLQGGANDMLASEAVEKLLRVVDVHKNVCMPMDWPGGEEKYRESSYLAWIGRILCRASAKIEVPGGQVLFWWKNVKSWTKKGVPVRAIGRSLGGGERFLAGGSTAVVMANYQMFRIMNTQQRVAAIYHALRMLSKEGAVRPPQFEGYFDELELFGVGTFEHDALLIRAVEAGLQTQLPWSNRLQTNMFEAAAASDPDTPDESHEQDAAA